MKKSNIYEQIRILKNTKRKLDIIENEIKYKRTQFEKKIELERKEFEESLIPLKENSNKALEELNLLSQTTISVSVRELVEELAILSGINISNIKIQVQTNVAYLGQNKLKRMHELIKISANHLKYPLSKSKQNCWTLSLYEDETICYNKNTNPFCYEMTFPLNLDELQADGKSLLEHSNIEIKYDFIKKDYYTIIIIDKKIKDLICNINLNQLISEDFRDENSPRLYSTNLLSQAVINCVEKRDASNTFKRATKIKKK